MIFQIYLTNTLGIKNLVRIPFQSGTYDVKLIRLDCNYTASFNFYLGFFITSDRLPFNTVTYYDPAGITRNVKGLLCDTRNSNLSNNQNTCFENFKQSYEFNRVMLDGYIDLSFFNSGLPGNFAFGLSPPNNTNTILLTLDITPSSEVMGIENRLNYSNLYQCVISPVAASPSTEAFTNVSYYGPCRIKIIRVDVLISPANNANLNSAFRIRSPDIQFTAGNNGLVCFSNLTFSTAYYSDNVWYNANSYGQIRFILSRLIGNNINPVAIAFYLEPMPKIHLQKTGI